MPRPSDYWTVFADAKDVKMYKRWVAVEEEERKEQLTESGIVLPAKPAGIIGRVVAIGDQAKEETGLKEGDLIVYERWQGGRWAFGTKKVLIMEVDHILAKIDESG